MTICSNNDITNIKVRNIALGGSHINLGTSSYITIANNNVAVAASNACSATCTCTSGYITLCEQHLAVCSRARGNAYITLSSYSTVVEHHILSASNSYKTISCGKIAIGIFYRTTSGNDTDISFLGCNSAKVISNITAFSSLQFYLAVVGSNSAAQIQHIISGEQLYISITARLLASLNSTQVVDQPTLCGLQSNCAASHNGAIDILHIAVLSGSSRLQLYRAAGSKICAKVEKRTLSCSHANILSTAHSRISSQTIIQVINVTSLHGP